MRLPPFEYAAPGSMKEALAILAEKGAAAAVLAGGTDLVPRLRQRLSTADTVVSIKHLDELRGIRVEGIQIRIGAGTSLQETMDHEEVQGQLPGLVEALKSVGARHIQHRLGTLGGNLMLETRCLQYNQSGWWRLGRDRCFKDGGQVCHALKDSQECSASCQADGAVMLMALSAQAVFLSKAGERVVPLSTFFTGKGDGPFDKAPEELLTEIRIIPPPPGVGMSYRKLRWRSAVDYPLVSAAAVVSLTKGVVDRARLVIGAAGPAPLVVDEADKLFRGQKPETAVIEGAAQAAQKAAEGKIIENAIAPAEYRRKMVRVLAQKALAEAVERAGNVVNRK